MKNRKTPVESPNTLSKNEASRLLFCSHDYVIKFLFTTEVMLYFDIPLNWQF